MKQSESLLSALLADSAITRTSHPALVALLELAAQGPGLEKGEDRSRWAPRISRQWHLVAEACRDVEKAGATDEMVKTLALHYVSGTHSKLRYAKGAWALDPFDPFSYRIVVAEFLTHISDCLKAKRLLAQVGL